MLNTLSIRNAALLIFGITAAALVGAWIFEYFGYAPCELCLLQRWPYYFAIPLALILAFAPSSIARNGLWLLAAILLFSAAFGAYHAGVEWKFWAGPDTCSGTGAVTGGLPDLTKPVVMCDEPSLRIFGISLAGWNAVITGALALLAAKTALRKS